MVGNRIARASLFAAALASVLTAKAASGGSCFESNVTVRATSTAMTAVIPASKKMATFSCVICQEHDPAREVSFSGS